MSYRKHHVKNKIHGNRPKKSILKHWWFWIFVLVVLLIGTVVYFLLFYPGIEIKNIEISGNQKISSQDLRNIAQAKIGEKLFGFLQTKSILFTDEISLKKYLLTGLPQIASINITKKFPDTILINVNERAPVGVYCATDCYLIDQTGIVFEKTDNLGGEVVVRQPDDTKNIFMGEEIVDANIMSAILKIQKDLKDKFQIDLKDALIADSSRLNVETGEGWQIYFDTGADSSIPAQLTKLNLLLNGEIIPKTRQKLQYIDLRFQARAYYK